ncbi:MAG TPA: endonuclease/exonuclease/phosphatase family protein [Flavitalea sp.]|nr:endonuclease/exonuclease/phosphatase family protein [Flavitalea sp.]
MNAKIENEPPSLVKHLMLLKTLFITGMIISILVARGQQPVFHENFEKPEVIETVQGIAGKALNLGPDARVRQVMVARHPLNGKEAGFSVTIWVRAEQQSAEPYDILSSLEKKDEQFDGWRIRVAARGGWEFHVRKGAATYSYATTARQTLRDGNWHLLAATYSATAKELRFYYDGNMMAIYRADSIEGFYAPQEMVIGGSIDSKYFFRNMRWESYWDSFNGQIDDITLYAAELPAAYIASYYQRISGKTAAAPAVNPITNLFKLTAFNIWHGGHEFGKETGKHILIDMLRNMNADAYTLVETYGSGPEIADALGYYLYLVSDNLSIVSRYPFTETYNLSSPDNSGAAQIQLSNGKRINLAVVWLDWLPSFIMKGFDNGEGWTKEKFLEVENKRRGSEIRTILSDLQRQIGQRDSIPLIVAGDFNSGSHLDWTEKTSSIHKGYTMPWPVSIAMQKAGFRDSFRELHPDPLKTPGTTFSDNRTVWVKTRVDYIYYTGKPLQAVESETVNKHPIRFPSDHAAVSTVFRITGAE